MAGGAMPTTTRPTLNLLLLLRASVRMYAHSPEGKSRADLGSSGCSQRPSGKVPPSEMFTRGEYAGLYSKFDEETPYGAGCGSGRRGVAGHTTLVS